MAHVLGGAATIGRPRLDGVRVLVGDDARYVLDVATDMLQCSEAIVTAVAPPTRH